MLSNIPKTNNDKINLISGIGICGIFLLGPLGYLAVGNIFLENIIEGNYYFDPALTNLSNIYATINFMYLFSFIGGIPGLIVGLAIGKLTNKKALGMEIGLVVGMSIWPILVSQSTILDISLYSLGGLVAGIFACYIGRKIGRYLGRVLSQKINPQ